MNDSMIEWMNGFMYGWIIAWMDENRDENEGMYVSKYEWMKEGK